MKETKIQKLYNNPKARGFVNHLIKAYLPVNKVVKVFSFEKNQSKTCNVCSQKLMSIDEAFQEFQNNREVIMSGMMSNMKAEAAAYLDKTELPKQENPIAKHVGKGRVLAFTGEKTDTCLCLQCTRDLLDMVQTGLFMGDSNISYQIKQMQRNQVFNHFTKSDHLDNQEKQKVKEIKKRVDKKKVATLGDLDVLQQLKEKMEQNETK